MTIFLMQMPRQDIACTPLEQPRIGELWTSMMISLLGPPVQGQPVQGQEPLVYLSRAVGGKLCPWMREKRLGRTNFLLPIVFARMAIALQVRSATHSISNIEENISQNTKESQGNKQQIDNWEGRYLRHAAPQSSSQPLMSCHGACAL